MRATRIRLVGSAAAMALALTACSGGGDPQPTTSVPSTAAISAAECGALEDAVTAVTAEHPEVGLAVGAVPTDDQIAVMHDLVDGLEAVDLTNTDLTSLRRAIVVASQSIIDRGGTQQPVTEEDQGAFAGALTAASDYCGGVTGVVTSTPPPTAPVTPPTTPATSSPGGPPATTSSTPVSSPS